MDVNLQPHNDTKWPFMCRCAVRRADKKPLIHMPEDILV